METGIRLCILITKLVNWKKLRMQLGITGGINTMTAEE